MFIGQLLPPNEFHVLSGSRPKEIGGVEHTTRFSKEHIFATTAIILPVRTSANTNAWP
jgi:hypothetical protein